MYYEPYALKILKDKHNKLMNDPNTTILHLKGTYKGVYSGEIYNIDGVYMLKHEHSEIYTCYPMTEPNEYGYNGDCHCIKKRDIIGLCQEIIRAKEPEKRQKHGLIYLDGKNENQPADTFNGTLLYVVIMLLLTVFNDRIIGWIGATVFYLIWKSSKYN